MAGNRSIKKLIMLCFYYAFLYNVYVFIVGNFMHVKWFRSNCRNKLFYEPLFDVTDNGKYYMVVRGSDQNLRHQETGQN